MERLVDADLDLGEPVVGEGQIVDLADRLTPHEDLVALDELAARLELDPVAMAAVAGGEQDVADEDDAHDQGDHRDGAGSPHPIPSLNDALLAGFNRSTRDLLLFVSAAGPLARWGERSIP